MIVAAWVVLALALIVEFAWWMRRIDKRFSWKKDLPLYAFSILTSLGFFVLWQAVYR